MGHLRLVASVAIAGVALLACGCGSSHRGATGRTTVQRYGMYPADTISVPTTDPVSQACRRDSVGLARASAGFVAHYGPQSLSPADVYYALMREEIADFDARRCDPKLLGRALAKRLSASQRRVLVANAPGRMAAVLRRALSAVGA